MADDHESVIISNVLGLSRGFKLKCLEFLVGLRFIRRLEDNSDTRAIVCCWIPSVVFTTLTRTTRDFRPTKDWFAWRKDIKILLVLNVFQFLCCSFKTLKKALWIACTVSYRVPIPSHYSQANKRSGFPQHYYVIKQKTTVWFIAFLPFLITTRISSLLKAHWIISYFAVHGNCVHST